MHKPSTHTSERNASTQKRLDFATFFAVWLKVRNLVLINVYLYDGTAMIIPICTHSGFQRADGSQDNGGGGHGDGDKGKKPLNQVSKRADLLKLGQLTLHLVFESTLSQQTRNSL